MKQLVTLLALSAAWAQTPPPVKSPETHSDRRVTFRLLAPKAADVRFFADWMKPGTNEKMTRNPGGLWTITVGPLAPGLYLYSFNLDGVTLTDPVNPRIKLRSRTSASIVEVTGPKPELWEPRDVPHGSVEISWHKSRTLGGETRQIWVYTPPGYHELPARPFPVLYLLHGHNGTAADWTNPGRANFILDNLLAQNRVRPMIVAMPYTHAVPFDAPAADQKRNVSLFEEYFVKDVMPYVETKYRVRAEASQRAVAGLSMGATEAAMIAFANPDSFSAVGVFSAGLPGNFEQRFGALLNKPDDVNRKLKLIWIGCGLEDPVLPGAERFAQLLSERKIQRTFATDHGMHTFTVWRQHLAEFAVMLFGK